MKEVLSTVLEAQSPSTNNWVQFVDTVVEHHNSQPAAGTSFVRNEINDSNFLNYLDERYGRGVEGYDVTQGFSSSSVDSQSLAPASAKKCFNYLPGDVVLVTRRSLNVIDDEGAKNSLFTKASISGNYSRIRFTVHSAKLRVTADPSVLIPGEIK